MKKRKLYLSIGAVTVLALLVTNCKTEEKKADCKEVESVKEEPAPTKEEMVARGAYLVGIMGCNDCHSPKKIVNGIPVPDEDLLLSGHPAAMKSEDFDKKTASKWVLFNMMNTSAVGPWGTSFAANLTSDETGIGNWTEEQFAKAMKEGKYKGMDGSRMLLPPMPWPNFSKIEDKDLKAIFAYLKSTKPVPNVVPAAIPPAGAAH